MGPIKEKIISVIQKLAGIVLACLMLVVVLPIGLMPDDTAEDKGSFIRISATDELYSSADAKKEGKSIIRRGECAYLKFSLATLSETDIDDIRDVRLRLAFFKGSGTLNNKISVKLLPGSVWQKGNHSVDFEIPFEREVSVIYPQTTGDEDSLSEIDVTEYVRESVKTGKTEIAFRLSSDTQIGTMLATGRYRDSAYRPSLKVMTGEAEDTDAYTLRKAMLAEAVYVSKGRPNRSGSELAKNGDLIVGGDNEAYLKFEVNDNAIFDTVYSARLSLCRSDGGGPAKIEVYTINNNQWTGDGISYMSRPRGEEKFASDCTISGDGRVNIDVTQAVCEARADGIKMITFRVVGATDTAIRLNGGSQTKTQPQLFINATDDKEVECVAEASINALGVNSYDFVTMNLPTAYTSKNGNTAKIRWSETDCDGEILTATHISRNGEITRPRWFEKDAEVVARARIQSGGYSAVREYRVTIPSETPPDYSKYKFDNYIDIGNSELENEHKFESVSTSGVRRRWTSGRIYDYRIPEAGGVMVLNLSCVGESRNYITLKLWEGDDASKQDFLLSPYENRQNDILLMSPSSGTVDDEGFVYATYALPREFTDGKSHITLCLECVAKNGAEQSAGERGIYSVYMTQSPFFSPEQFKTQGENVISEPRFGEGMIQRFIDNLRLIAIPVDVGEAIQETRLSQTNVSVDAKEGMAIISGDDINIAFSADYENKSAVIYEKLKYYDRYCYGCPVAVENDTAVVDYGEYKLVFNKSEEESKPFPYWRTEMSGVYKDAISGKYYTYSEEWQMTDDSAIPEDADILNGRELMLEPQTAVLLIHIADSIYGSDWRVSHINGEGISKLTLGEDEKIKNVTVKAVGGIEEGAEAIEVVMAIYDNGKLLALSRKREFLSESAEIYTIDFSDEELYMKSSRELKIFIFDNKDDKTTLAPKFEIL